MSVNNYTYVSNINLLFLIFYDFTYNPSLKTKNYNYIAP